VHPDYINKLIDAPVFQKLAKPAVHQDYLIPTNMFNTKLISQLGDPAEQHNRRPGESLVALLQAPPQAPLQPQPAPPHPAEEARYTYHGIPNISLLTFALTKRQDLNSQI
jgi:hypothetical protein